MTNQLTILEQKLTANDMRERIAVALDLRPEDEASQREAFSYISSALQIIKDSEGSGSYTDLTTCTPESICGALIDAAQFRIKVDGRKLGHLEKRGNKAVFQIDTNGFVAKIKERYPDFTYSITRVFKGDAPPKIVIKDGSKTFEHISTNPFGGVADLQGFLVFIGYTNQGGKYVSDVHTVSIDEMNMIKSKGKSTAWRDFTLERMNTAALKRATKWHFRQDATFQKMVDYDDKNYDLSQEAIAAPDPNSIVDNLNADIIDGEVMPDDEKEQIPTVTYYIKGKTSSKEFTDIMEWKKTVEKTVKKFDKLEQFATFVQLNHASFDLAMESGHETVIDEINNLMNELQEKMQVPVEEKNTE